MKEIAIIGPTGSGKSDLALQLAHKHNAYILSLDSLSIYKEIDIVSAKPSKEELRSIPHFGIDILYPDQHFSVEEFIQIYKQAKKSAQEARKNLIIVGGTLFYLKALLVGLSPMPHFSQDVIEKVQTLLREIPNAYELLRKIDPLYAKKITKQDRYRIQKALLIYFQTNLPPTEYFNQNPPQKILDNLPIFAISIDRETLGKRLEKRTKKMLKEGLVEEIFYLEKRYGRSIHPMKAIGIVETLEYLDGKYGIDRLIERITTNSRRLAKRQQTFMRTQFHNTIPIHHDKHEKIQTYLNSVD